MKTVSPKQRIEDLEECLAGFMLTGAANGMFIDTEMANWCRARLLGKQRTPVQVWREIVTTPVSLGKQQTAVGAVLICEDASHLGGPMGSEYTTEMWRKEFASVKDAKAYAEKDAEKYIDGNWSRKWTKHSTGNWGWDARAVIYTVEKPKRKK